MSHETDPHRHPSLAKLAYIFPLGSLLVVIIGGVIMISKGVSAGQVGLVLSGLGVGLAIAYFALSLVRAHTRSGGRTALSIVLAVLLMIFGAGSLFAEYVLVGFALSFSASLSDALQDAATQAGGPAGTFLTTGKTGVLVSPKWTNPNGGEVVIGISWARNADGLLVTASPSGPVPKGQDGSPQTQQVLNNGRLGFPLNYFTVEAKSDPMHLFDNWLLMFNDMVNGSASPIIKHAKEHGGQLPAAAEADSLLSKATKVFKFDASTGAGFDADKVNGHTVGDGDGTKSLKETKFVIESYTYHNEKPDMFTIDYAWSCDYVADGSKSKSNHSDSEMPVTGVITIDFAASGFIVMEMKDGQLQNPLYEVLEAYNKRSNEAAAAAGSAAGS